MKSCLQLSSHLLIICLHLGGFWGGVWRDARKRLIERSKAKVGDAGSQAVEWRDWQFQARFGDNLWWELARLMSFCLCIGWWKIEEKLRKIMIFQCSKRKFLLCNKNLTFKIDFFGQTIFVLPYWTEYLIGQIINWRYKLKLEERTKKKLKSKLKDSRLKLWTFQTSSKQTKTLADTCQTKFLTCDTSIAKSWLCYVYYVFSL